MQVSRLRHEFVFVPDDDRNDRGWRAVLDDNLHIEKFGGTYISMIQQAHVRTLGQASLLFGKMELLL